MSNDNYYQYAFSQTDCRVQGIGSGVDPRFEIELVCSGPIAAVVSRVGFDQFDVEKLQGKNAEDIRWLNHVALRHNEIIHKAAGSSPVLPLRLGTIFKSRISLLARMVRCRATITDFFRAMGDRQEWAVKLYIQEINQVAERPCLVPPKAGAMTGADYLKRRGAELRRRRELQAGLHREVMAVENKLAAGAGRCRRIRPLPGTLTGRRERMVFNAAYLLPSAEVEQWMASMEKIRNAILEKGLLLEVSGPWPPYHFCPELAMSTSEST